MTEFKHSIVLFTGDDGLPLEFNVRNTKDKIHLKELIEHGGGFCSQSDNAVHLISPGTKVLNADLGKKLVSSSYIYDCVKENYLLDVNDYVFTISEVQTSDISDEDSERLLAMRQSTCKSPNKCPVGVLKLSDDISPIKAPSHNDTGSTTNSNITIPSSNNAIPQISNSSSTHSESFVEGSQDVTSNFKITSHVYFGNAPNVLPKSSEVMNSPSKLKTLCNTTSEVKSPNALKNNVHISNEINEPTDISKKVKSDYINKDLMSPDINCKLMSPTKSSGDCKKLILDSDNQHQPVDHLCNMPSEELLKMVHVKDPESPLVTKTLMSSPVQATPSKKTLEVHMENILSPNRLGEDEQDKIHSSAAAVSPLILTKENAVTSLVIKVNEDAQEMHVQTEVTSSQPEDDNLDQFDNMLLSKIQKPQLENEDSLSQSYTVSSSADAQITSKPCSAEKEPQKDSAALPDSPSLIASPINEIDYMKNLEAEVKEILLKPSPKSIQDKIALVKYICCAKRLPPATVLESLLKNSLE